MTDHRPAPAAWRQSLRRVAMALRGKALSILTLLVVVAVALLVAPKLNLSTLSDWSASMGWMFPAVFVLLHAVITVAPIPRTIFTLAAGILFGPVLGLGVAVLATMLSAVAAFILVRAIGRDVVERKLTHPMARAVEARLERRGWLAVGSLRMIGFVPFSVVNYCSAVSAVRFAPYLLATFVGILPGTVSVVLFGDMLNTGYNPVMLAVSVVGAGVGILGLLVDAKLGVDIKLPELGAAGTVSSAASVPAVQTSE